MTGDDDREARLRRIYTRRSGLYDLLEKGSVFALEHKRKPEIKLRLRLCRPGDLEDILALQERVYDAIEDKDTFVLTTREELVESLEQDTCIGAFDGELLVAFTLMVTNPDSARNLAKHLDYSADKSAKCVTYDTTFVHPDYTGYGLQRVFIRLKDLIALNMGAAEALATVSPDNPRSLNNLQAGGFEVAARKEMYSGVERLILRKKLSRRLRWERWK
jgi:hypothetical protein